MNIFSYLFQPDKSKLSPAGRAFIAWLEIVLVSIPAAVAGTGLDYLNGHPGDYRGMLPFVVSAMVVAILKALTTLGVSMKNTSVTLPDVIPAPPPPPVQAATLPPVIIHNNIPAPPEPKVIQVAPVPQPPALVPAASGPSQQFKAPLPATVTVVPAPPSPLSIPDTTTVVVPAVTIPPEVRDWKAFEGGQ